jgi:hypothetical protein
LGILIPGAEGIPPGLPYKGSSFPFLAPNHSVTIAFKETKVEAVSRIFCTATDYCNDGCYDTRCPDSADGFSGTSTGFVGSNTEYTRAISQGLPVDIYQESGSRITYSGGVSTIDFNVSSSSVYLTYQGTAGCFIGDPSETLEAQLDFNLPNVDANGGGFYVEMEYGGTYIGYDVYSSAIHPGHWNPPNISANTWYTIKYQVSNLDSDYSEVRFKIWQAGTAEPSSWDITTQASSITGGFIVVAYGNTAPTSFALQLRNLTVRRV